MQEQIIPDLYAYLDILSREIKQSGSTQAAMENIKINLRHSHDQIQYEKTALARLLSHPLYNIEAKEQSDIPKPVKTLLEWFTHKYHPNPFLEPDLFYRLLKNKQFYQLYCILTNLTLTIDGRVFEDIKGVSSCKIGYDSLNWESTNPHELVVYGYLCQFNLLYIQEDGLLHNNPVVALTYFVKAAYLGFDCWKEIERVITTTSLKPLLEALFSEELFKKTTAQILSDISHEYYYQIIIDFAKESSEERLSATFNNLNTMLQYVNNGSTFYLKAESMTYAHIDTELPVSQQIRQLNLYLQAASYNHFWASLAFSKGWEELTKKPLTPLDMSAFLDFNKLLVSSVGGFLLNRKVTILECIEYCDALHLKLSDIETNSELISTIETFFEQVISSNKIDKNLPASALGKLIPIISSVPKPSFSLLDLKKVIDSKINALIAEKKDSSPIINNSSLPEKKENSPIITNGSLPEKIDSNPIINNGSLDESEAQEEKLLPAQDSEYIQLLKLLQEPAISKFNLPEEKSSTGLQNPVRLFPARRNRVEGSSTGLIRSHSCP